MSHSKLEIASVWAKQKEKEKESRTRSGNLFGLAACRNTTQTSTEVKPRPEPPSSVPGAEQLSSNKWFDKLGDGRRWLFFTRTACSTCRERMSDVS